MTQAHQIGPGQTADTVVISIRGGDAESHNSETPKVVSQFEFDPGMYELGNSTLSLKFVAVAGNGVGGLTTHARLYNLTDAEYVGSGLSFTLVDPTKLEETLTIGSGAGQIKEASKLYEIRIWVDSPVNPEDAIELGSAELRVINTVN
jgi:hypothetical protein